MPDIGHPVMPMYINDQTDYMRQMHEWHIKMVQYHDQQRAHHAERAQQFQQLIGGSVQSVPRGVRRRPVKNRTSLRRSALIRPS